MATAKFIKSVIEKSYRKGVRGTRQHFYSVTGYGVTREITVVPHGAALDRNTNEASRSFTRSEALKTFEAQIAWELKRISEGLPTGHNEVPIR